MIFLLSSQSFETVHLKHGTDKLVHLFLYGGFGYLLLRAFHQDGQWTGRDAWVILIVVLYGISDEWHQSFVPGRSVEALDVFADALGGVSAVIFGNVADRLGWKIWF
ncbi:MAG: VanZ family protein [Deltaproteobacteria bacterium]|nr:VanZ family protein [Deltaproteobacteria bacterium]